MKDIIKKHLEESIRVKVDFIENNPETIENCADDFASCIGSGHKIMFFGNGGSAADSQHVAAEFVNRFQVEREPLPGIALTTDTSVITSIGNDYSFDDIFAKQVFALGQKDDIVVGISTSGNSKNVIRGISAAKEIGARTVAFTGAGGGKLGECSDMIFAVPSRVTARIQETHITVFHILCDLVERILFPEKF